MADQFKAQIGSGIVALVSVADGKVSFVASVTADLVNKINAVDIVNIGSKAVGGKGGGGRPDMAQAGGPNVGDADSALSQIEDFVQTRISG